MIQLKRFNNADVVVRGDMSGWQNQTGVAYNQTVKMQEQLDLSTHVFGGADEHGQMCRTADTHHVYQLVSMSLHHI